MQGPPPQVRHGSGQVVNGNTQGANITGMKVPGNGQGKITPGNQAIGKKVPGDTVGITVTGRNKDLPSGRHQVEKEKSSRFKREDFSIKSD
jgi:hypothetical protein